MTRLEDPHALADRAPRSHCGARLLGRQGGALFMKHAGRDLLPPLAFTRLVLLSPKTCDGIHNYGVPNYEPRFFGVFYLLPCWASASLQESGHFAQTAEAPARGSAGSAPQPRYRPAGSVPAPRPSSVSPVLLLCFLHQGNERSVNLPGLLRKQLSI